ncbi:MAG: Hsp20/alpha crystallin family protein [Desulfatitalea sp.]|nr:Hsp20/alpha crystallin family protein [Desulfatitalea sp.]NNK02812.1 Hsp20/alpha crystallin family protein [Desulfatitalea sp.]
MLYSRLYGTPLRGSLRSFEELTRMRRQMDRIMDAFAGRPGLETGAGVFPATNLTEDDSFFYLRAELPGVKAEDLDIQATGRNLTIAGLRKLDVENASARYHRREREGGRFSRAFALPREIDPDRIEAKVLNGILTLKVPKAESAKPRRITIES